MKSMAAAIVGLGLVVPFLTFASGATDGAAASRVAAAPGALGAYEEPITVSWSIQTAAASKLLDDDTWEDNRWSRLIKEQLNIDLEVAFTADSSTDAYRTKLNAVIAAGDLPDIFKTQDANVFLQLVQNDQLADLTDVYNEYATDSIKSYQERFADAYEGASFNGRLYAIPRMNDNFHNAPFLWIRDDWLENTNSEPPTTIAELVALAELFATGDPDGNGVDGDTYGLALNRDLIRQNHASILGLVAAFGVPGHHMNMFYRDADGNMTFSWIQPGMKPALALLNDMYERGLINQEFTAKDESALVEDWTSGRIGMAYGSNWGTWYPYNNVYKRDGVITRAYPIPTADGYDYKVGIQSNRVGQVTMVSAGAQYPEAAIKILNLYDETVNFSGDEAFARYWADEQYRLSPVYIDIPNEVYQPEVNEALAKGSAEGMPAFARRSYEYVIGFEDGSLADNDNAYGTWGQQNANGSLNIVLQRYQPDNAVVQSIVAIERPDVWLTNVSVLETLAVTAFTEIIIGQRPVDYFDTFVEQWLRAGGQATLDALDELYPAN